MDTNPNEGQIDLLELFYALKKRILWIVIAGLIFACGAGVYTQMFIAPTYTSTATILVLSKETTLTSMADLSFGTQLSEDYQVLIRSNPVMREVIDRRGKETNFTPGSLKASLSVTNPSSRILKLSVTGTDPLDARDTVNVLAEVASEYVGDKMEVIPPKIIEEGEIPTGKNGPDLKKNIFIGLLAGVALSCGLVVLFTLMNDSIKTEDDITRYLGIPTLATVPDRKDYVGGKKKKRKKRKNAVHKEAK